MFEIKKGKSKSESSGFTLVELVLYVSIVSLVLFALSFSLWRIIEGGAKRDAAREVVQNADFALGKIIRAVQNASSVAVPSAAGQVSTSLELNMQDLSKSPTLFTISGGKITIEEGAGESYPLTSEEVEVVNLQFSNLSYPSGPPILRITMTLNYINPGGRSEYTASVTLETSASLRAQ